LSDLAQRQRALLAVLKGRTDHADAGCAHAQMLLASPHAAMLREIVLWWREFLLGRDCRFTTALLKRRGDFAAKLADFVRTTPGSALIEQQSDCFLAYLAGDPDELVAAMAKTERVLIRSRRQPGYRGSVMWRHDPAAVFAFVLHGIPFEDAAIAGAFRFVAGSEVAGGMQWSERSRDMPPEEALPGRRSHPWNFLKSLILIE
jgi:hypothetical protein